MAAACPSRVVLEENLLIRIPAALHTWSHRFYLSVLFVSPWITDRSNRVRKRPPPNLAPNVNACASSWSSVCLWERTIRTLHARRWKEPIRIDARISTEQTFALLWGYCSSMSTSRYWSGAFARSLSSNSQIARWTGWWRVSRLARQTSPRGTTESSSGITQAQAMRDVFQSRNAFDRSWLGSFVEFFAYLTLLLWER